MAYGEPQGLTFATRGVRGPLGISFESLLALGGIFDERPEATPQSAPAAADETPAGLQA